MTTTTRTTPTTPTAAHAAGMLAGLVAGHTCTTACNAVVQLGPDTRQLRCPYTQLDVNTPADRLTIGALYALSVPRG